MNQNKPNKKKIPIMIPLYLFLSSAIEKYSQISYLQRNEQNSSWIKTMFYGLVRFFIWFKKGGQTGSNRFETERKYAHNPTRDNMATAPIPAPTSRLLQELKNIDVILCQNA